MEAPTKEELIFHVALTRSTIMLEPDYGKWDGEERVEQALHASLNIHDFCELLREYCFDDTCFTQGLGVEGGYILPARSLNEGGGYDSCGSNDTSCYVSVCTKEIYDRVIRDASKPADVPVVQKNFTVKPEKLSFIETEAFFNATLQVLDEMTPLCDIESLGGYADNDEVEDELYKRICLSLVAVEA